MCVWFSINFVWNVSNILFVGAKDFIEEILALMNKKAQGNDATSTIEKNDIPTPKRRGASTKRGSSGKLHAVAKADSTKRKTGESKGCKYIFLMTSPNGNIFCVIGPFCGEFTGHRRIPFPAQRQVTRSFDI